VIKQIEPELFENTLESNGVDNAAIELEHWMWAGRVLKEASEEAASEDRNRRNFIHPKNDIRMSILLLSLAFLLPSCATVIEDGVPKYVPISPFGPTVIKNGGNTTTIGGGLF